MPDVIKMPEYQCHKKVWALQISQVQDLKKKGGVLHFENTDYAPVEVDEQWMERHRPHEGGYYVAYDDQYTSFSPAAAFEAGYSPIPNIEK